MVEIVTVFLLFFLNLVIIPFITLGFEPPKVFLAEIAIGLILVLCLIKGKLSFHHFNKIQLILTACLLLLSLIQLILNFQLKDLFGNIFRLQGALLLGLLLVFSAVSSQLRLNLKFKYLFFASLLLLFITSLLLGTNPAGRAVGTLGEPNALAASAIFILPFIFYSIKNKFFLILSLALVFLIIFLTQSASGLVGLVVEAVFVLAIYVMKLPSSKSALLALLLILFSLYLPFLSFQYLKPSSRFENRALIWQTAAMAGLEKPIWGHGVGSLQEVLLQTAQKLNNNIQYVVVDSSHNFILDSWVETGGAGVFLMILLICFSLSKMVASDKDLEITALLGVISVMLFNPVSVVTLVAFWWLIGQGFRKEGN